ncbi:autotransporter outer membrane beta-barrel domain-containing protein [Aminobacter sp. BA135]|uniref:autotransporter family protein n=1 Tax=Aminobacter sp. BA135 TaxID=537596 RepID=UPI003D7AEF1D
MALLLASAPVAAQQVILSGDTDPSDPTVITSGDDLQIGRTGTGALTIQDGGTLTNRQGTLGSDIGGNGTVIVSGRDGAGNASSWTNTDSLTIGAQGSGRLDILDGGVVTDSGGVVGNEAGSTGSVTVSGHGSWWNNLGDVVIGQSGDGTLDILSGGRVSSATAYVGASPGSVGVVTVSGDDGQGNASSWTQQDNLNVGYEGSGTLNVAHGGRVVTGGRINIGTYGQGKMTISDGASVSSHDAIIGVAGSGEALLTSAGSWTMADQLTVGLGGQGVLRIEGGARVTSSQGYVGANAGGDGSVTVTGAGSSWEMTRYNLTLGNYGVGAMTIADGARVLAQSGVYLGISDAAASGTLEVRGTPGARGVLETSGFRGGIGTAHVTLDGGIIRAIADNATFFRNYGAQQISLGTAGGIIDTNGHDIGIAPEMTGAGGLTKDGLGRLTLTGANSYAGGTTVASGVLAAGAANVFSAGSAHMVLGGGTLALDGFDQTVASLNNAGRVTFGRTPGTTLTVAGDYTGNGGALEIATALGTDSAPTDLLVIGGNSIGGTTLVSVINVGGTGGLTTADGIRIIEVDGTSAAGAFALSGPAIAGAYRYGLFHNGIADPADGDWYLRSAGLAPTLPVYETYPQLLLGMVELPTLKQRVGARYETALDGAASDGAVPGPGATPGGAAALGGSAWPGAIWARIEGAHGRVTSASSSSGSTGFDSTGSLLQAGLDGQLASNAQGMWVGGLTVHYGRAGADIFSGLGDGTASTTSYGVGATLSWFGENGFYVDGQVQIALLRSDLDATGIGRVGDDIHGSGHALSLEAGRNIALGDGWSLTPQAQLAWSSVDFDSFTDRFGAVVSLKDGDSLKGRIGVAANHEAAATQLHGIANLTYQFGDGTSVLVSGLDTAFAVQRFRAELGFGATYRWAGGTLHGEALASTSFAGSYGVKGTVGFAMNF